MTIFFEQWVDHYYTELVDLYTMYKHHLTVYKVDKILPFLSFSQLLYTETNDRRLL